MPCQYGWPFLILKINNKNDMQKLKQYWVIILLIVVILGGLFYWFELRPAKIISDCSSIARSNAKLGYESFASVYDDCLMANGIKP